ncbi:MAG: hypothetical protein ABIL58_23230 [Pseudomonadota bacterium]
MPSFNIPTKAIGDQLTPAEFNSMVAALWNTAHITHVGPGQDIQAAINATDPPRLIVISGVHEPQAEIDIPSYTVIDARAAKFIVDTQTPDVPNNLFQNADRVTGNEHIHILGGEMDGSWTTRPGANDWVGDSKPEGNGSFPTAGCAVYLYRVRHSSVVGGDIHGWHGNAVGIIQCEDHVTVDSIIKASGGNGAWEPTTGKDYKCFRNVFIDNFDGAINSCTGTFRNKIHDCVFKTEGAAWAGQGQPMLILAAALQEDDAEIIGCHFIDWYGGIILASQGSLIFRDNIVDFNSLIGYSGISVNPGDTRPFMARIEGNEFRNGNGGSMIISVNPGAGSHAVIAENNFLNCTTPIIGKDTTGSVFIGRNYGDVVIPSLLPFSNVVVPQQKTITIGAIV